MKRIASFEVDHTKIACGMYISRIDGDIVTYDLRTRKPNVESVMDNDCIHTLEHLFATFVRNSEYSESIIYFGPMGCRTGFYFLTRSLDHVPAIKLTQDAMRFIMSFEGDIPGVSLKECGNYREHSLEKAKKEAEMFLNVIINWNENMLNY